MGGVPYLFVNICCLCIFSFLFITFLAAKKTRVIKYFMLLMAGFILWSGGAILMRLRVFPGMEFWFYVSIMSLFAIALLIMLFVYAFAGLRRSRDVLIFAALTLPLEVLTAFGLILQPPTVGVLPGGGVVFTYEHLTAAIAVPFVFFLCYIVMMVRVFRFIVRERGLRAPGVLELLIGCLAVWLGNLLQLLPGNIFPYDALGGLINALLIVWALYKKRMFQLNLLVSRYVIILAGVICAVAVFVHGADPLWYFMSSHLGLARTPMIVLLGVTFSLIQWLMYFLLSRLVDAIFTREEQQSRVLQAFSTDVSNTLRTGDIMEKFMKLLREEIAVRNVYVCLAGDDGFDDAYSSELLARRHFRISLGCPCVKLLERGEPYIMMSEFRRSPQYMSVWQEERSLFNRLELECIFPLRSGEEIVGLVLLTAKESGTNYNYAELSFLETVASIASIGLKNARLYEQVYREARVDSLTGSYNYRYFRERIDTEFALSKDDCIALLNVDIDDFKVYNQLYGSVDGDGVLRDLAEMLSLAAGSAGTVFRCSGKTFSVLLPHYDARKAQQLAEDIRARVSQYNTAPERLTKKPITVSCGICVAPFAASSAKELVENADLAVFSAKETGKNRVVVFRGGSPTMQSITERTLSVVQNVHTRSAAYQANTATISALTATIDSKDHYTFNHSKDVAMYAAVLATAAGMNEDQVRIVYEAGLLHDIGKISVPETILGKAGKLTGEEFEIIKGHVIGAVDIIRHLPQMDYVLPGVLGHHERWDGKGYPQGLAGEEIPYVARCLAIADAFDAMTTDRPYRKGLTFDYASEEIEAGTGTQFDPGLAGLFVKLIRNGEISSALSHV